jgi:hypothetical protein
MATTDYCTVADLNEYLLGSGKTQALQAGNFAAAIAAASRLIDDYCGRRFWIDDAVTPRRFTADDFVEVLLPDIATATDLEFKTDEDFDGVYETDWVIDSYTGAGFRLWPTNAQTDPDIKLPYTRARAISTSFPVHDLAIEVTAKWGWPAVPDAVVEACLLQSARLWKRKDAVLGVGGAAETGFFELRRRMDPDVRRLIDPYRNFAQPVYV